MVELTEYLGTAVWNRSMAIHSGIRITVNFTQSAMVLNSLITIAARRRVNIGLLSRKSHKYNQHSFNFKTHNKLFFRIVFWIDLCNYSNYCLLSTSKLFSALSSLFFQKKNEL